MGAESELRDRFAVALAPLVLEKVGERISAKHSLPAASSMLMELHAMEEQEDATPQAIAEFVIAKMHENQQRGDRMREHLRGQIYSEAAEETWRIVDALMVARGAV